MLPDPIYFGRRLANRNGCKTTTIPSIVKKNGLQGLQHRQTLRIVVLICRVSPSNAKRMVSSGTILQYAFMSESSSANEVSFPLQSVQVTGNSNREVTNMIFCSLNLVLNVSFAVFCIFTALNAA